MAFTGRATDSEGVFLESPEDVSPIITIISPHETPLLALVGDAPNAAERQLHEWLEDALTPNAYVTSTAIASAGASAGDSLALGIKDGLAQFLMEGSILQLPESAGMEQLYVSQVIKPNTIVVTRGWAGTTIATSLGTGVSMLFISEAQLEGRDVDSDISRPRSRKHNFPYVAMKDLKMSGSEAAQMNIGGMLEVPYQVRARTKEALRDLNKAIIFQRWSGNTIGGALLVRTMKGLLQFHEDAAANIRSFGSFSADNLSLTAREAWRNGGTDLTHVVCGDLLKNQIDNLNISRVRTTIDENRYKNRVGVFDSTYAILDTVLDRWMPAGWGSIIARDRVKVLPVQRRSFHYEEIAKTGDNVKGMIVGEYTLEVRNVNGMALIKVPSLGETVTP